LMQRFRGNYQHIHFRASACFFECLRRGSAEHPSESCPARSNRYQKAYNGVALDQGYGSMTEPLGSCTCPPTTTTEGPTSA